VSYDNRIASVPVPACRLCGSRGDMLYERLTDLTYAAPGEWNLRRCRNTDCGLVWLDPTPSEEEIHKAYRVYYTHPGYIEGEKRIDWWNYLLLKGCKPLQKLFLRVSGIRKFEKEWRSKADDLFLDGPPPGGKLLDVGCGKGDFLVRMSRKGWKVEGTEVDSGAVEQASVKNGLTVHTGTLEDAGFPTDSFDAVTMNHVIEHVHDPVSVLQACLRLLKPSGRLVAITPNLDGVGHERFGRNWRGLEPPRHLHLFTRRTLKECAAQAGFRSIETWCLPGYADAILQSSMDIEERATGKKRGEFSRWVEVSLLKVREYSRYNHKNDVGEEVVLMARKDS